MVIQKKKISFILLGCDKNRVDLEHMMGNLQTAGLVVENNETQAEIIVVQTCAFLESARQEAIETILETAKLKQIGKLEKLIVSGCLPMIELENLKKALPEVDAFIEVKEQGNILHTIKKLYEDNIDVNMTNKKQNQRILSTMGNYAYLKIAEGCNNFCSYCLIPFIRGGYQSVPFEQLVQEGNMLADGGVKELILVAQDITRYGVDLYKKLRLVELIQALSKIKNIRFIRLMYAYPEEITEELIDEIINNPKVCKYIDVPMQHIHDEILQKMNRRTNSSQLKQLVNKLQDAGITIRSTYIVGFPGEKSKHFKALKEFIKLYKPDHAGFFAYSKEPNTKASQMKRQVPRWIKKWRLRQMYKLQEKILQMKRLNNMPEEAVCENMLGEGEYILRAMTSAPEIDSVVYITTKQNLTVGEFYTIQKTGKINAYDFKGEII